jgi:hypothetical protein
LNEWARTYGAQGLKIIAVHGHGSGRPVSDAVASWGITYPVAVDRGATWDAYGVRATPTFALVGRDGELLHRQVGKITTPATAQLIEAALGGS